MPIEPGLGMFIKVISEALEQYANNQLQSRNLTFSQSKLLMVLGNNPDHTASMKELEEAFHSAQSTVCGIVSRMEKKGLVQALPCGTDKRVKRIALTPDGEIMRLECIDDIRDSESWLTLALDEQEREQLRQLLRKIIAEKWSSGIFCCQQQNDSIKKG